MNQGHHATKDEITACAYQAVNIDNKYNGAPVQVRVVMGKEPRHFLAIFKGKLVIFEVRFLSLKIIFCCITNDKIAIKVYIYLLMQCNHLKNAFLKQNWLFNHILVYKE